MINESELPETPIYGLIDIPAVIDNNPVVVTDTDTEDNDTNDDWDNEQS